MSYEAEDVEQHLVCALPSAELASRRKEVQEFVERAQSIMSIPYGLQFVFPNTNEIAHALVDFILFEQKCCAAVSYELQSIPPHGEIVLQLHASGTLLASLHNLYLGASGAPTTTGEISNGVDTAFHSPKCPPHYSPAVPVKRMKAAGEPPK